MHFAAKKGAHNVLIGLVSRGAGIDPTDLNDKTPLTIAIENKKFSIVRSLVELGADIEFKDSFGRTPLLYSCKIGSVEIVELLLNLKADINACNEVGDNCMSMAKKSNN